MTEKVRGLKDTLAALEKMGESLTDKEIKPILVKEGEKIADTMRALVRGKSGRLRNSIGVVNPNKFPGVVIIGPNFKIGGGTLSIAALAAINEYGAKGIDPKNLGRRAKKKHKVRGWYRIQINGEWVTINKQTKDRPARPFIRPAFDKHRMSAVQNIKRELVRVINQKAKKLNLK
jgi:hypothetical protein